MILESYSEEETYNIGMMIGAEARIGDVFCLDGDLGVGKTAFTKGFAKALMIEENITSPTFNIVNTYEGFRKLFHFDVYRIKYEDELDDIGFDEYLFGDGLCLIEWAKNIKNSIPKDAIWIEIEKDFEKGENFRRIKIDEVEDESIGD